MIHCSCYHSDTTSCPYGGKYMSDKYCYLLVTSSETWSKSNSYCGSQFGGWLANITDVDTLDMITDLLTSSSTRYVVSTP